MSRTATVNYEALFDALPGRYIAFLPDDPDFTIAAISNTQTQDMMVKREDVLGKPLLAAFPDTSEQYQNTGVSELLESLRQVIETGKPSSMLSLRYDVADHQGIMAEKHWKITQYPIFNASGGIELICQETEDITEEVTASEKLQQAQDRLQDVLAIGKIGTRIWDVQRGIVYGDKNMAVMYGIDEERAAEGLPYKEFLQAIHPDDRYRLDRQLNQTLESGTTYENEYRTIDKHGSVRWLIIRGRIERDKAGKPVRFPGVVVDITERKQIELNLEFLTKASSVLATSLDYTKTLKSIAELVVPDIADWCSIDIIDENGQIQQLAVTHKEPEKVKWATELRKRQGPPDLTAPNGIGKVLGTGEAEFLPHIPDEVLVVSAKNPEDLQALRELGLHSAMIVPLKAKDKTIGAITLVSAEHKHQFSRSDLQMAEELARRASMAVVNAYHFQQAEREIAARKLLEDTLRDINSDLEKRVSERTVALQTTNVSLERSNEELQNFAYVASHDLQEPLRKIQAFGNLLEEEYGDKLGDGRDYLIRMRGAAARMSALIEDILAFSRVTTKAREFTRTNLQEVVDGVLEDLETRIKDTGGTVNVKKLPTIFADPMQMRQLFQNLIANALKFHKPGVPPVVNIEAVTEISQTDKIRYTTIRIEDNGVGFDEKYLDRIFAVFQRLHARDSYEGTGIGLAVCRKIVERHGGTITASSQPGKGATFIVLLPLSHKQGETL